MTTSTTSTTEKIMFLGKEREHLSKLTPEEQFCFPLVYQFHLKKPDDTVGMFDPELIGILKPACDKEGIHFKPEHVMRACNGLVDEGLLEHVKNADNAFVGYRLAPTEEILAERKRRKEEAERLEKERREKAEALAKELAEEKKKLEEKIRTREVPTAVKESREQRLHTQLAKYFSVVIDKKYERLAKWIQAGEYQNIMFIGPPGTGKTTVANKLGTILERPVYSINFSLNIEETQVLGGWVPDTSGESQFRFAEGQFTEAFTYGGVFVAEELNYAKPGVAGMFNSALDSTGLITLMDGTVRERHPDFVMVVAMNVGLPGTQKLNDALTNRFEITYEFEEMPIKDEVQIVKTASGFTNEKIIEKMLETKNAINEDIKATHTRGAWCSIRNVIAWAKMTRLNGEDEVIESSWNTICIPTNIYDNDFRDNVKRIVTSNFE